ncbi:MAG TPA: helix-turn-helix domain-containing protein [Kofleriaceae bacterium]
MGRKAIRDLPFKHNTRPGLGFEIFRLADLFARVPEHELAAPQRPEFHTLYLGLRGNGSLVVDFENVPLRADTLTVVARGRVQQFAPARDLDAWMLLCSPEFIELDPRSVDPLRGASVLDPSWDSPAVRLPASDRKELLALAEQLAVEQARAPDAFQPAVIASVLRAILLRAERLARASDTRPRLAPALARFFTILERDCATTRSVAHYAKAAGLSPRRLAELLVERTGKSTKQIIDDRVVLEHKRLLAHTDVSVKELADRTGFDEPTNLIKFFRERTGVTPQDFRRNLPSARRS